MWEYIVVILFFMICVTVIVCVSITNSSDIDTFTQTKRTSLLEKFTKMNMTDINIWEEKFNSIPIYYINLDRSKIRKKFMEDQFNLYNLPYTRVSAIDGKKIHSKKGRLDDYLQYATNYTIIENTSKQVINYSLLACTLSHLKAILTAYENGDEWALILEDDACLALSPFWDQDLKSVIKQVPKGWGCLNLHTLRQKCLNNRSKILSFDKYGCWSAVCYIVNRKGMKDILEGLYEEYRGKGTFILDKTDPKNHKDIVADLFIYNRTKSYTYNDIPLIFAYNPNDMDSTIHPEHLSWQHKMTYDLFNKKN